MVEDAKAGIEAAKAGGMTALALFGDANFCLDNGYLGLRLATEEKYMG